eukprot:33895_1
MDIPPNLEAQIAQKLENDPSFFDAMLKVPNPNPRLTVVEKWLADIGLAQYAQNFMSNGYEQIGFICAIDDSRQLDEIGIVLSGHRAVIMREIKKLNNASICDGELKSCNGKPSKGSEKRTSNDNDVDTSKDAQEDDDDDLEPMERLPAAFQLKVAQRALNYVLCEMVQGTHTLELYSKLDAVFRQIQWNKLRSIVVEKKLTKSQKVTTGVIRDKTLATLLKHGIIEKKQCVEKTNDTTNNLEVNDADTECTNKAKSNDTSNNLVVNDADTESANAVKPKKKKKKKKKKKQRATGDEEDDKTKKKSKKKSKKKRKKDGEEVKKTKKKKSKTIVNNTNKKKSCSHGGRRKGENVCIYVKPPTKVIEEHDSAGTRGDLIEFINHNNIKLEEWAGHAGGKAEIEAVEKTGIWND